MAQTTENIRYYTMLIKEMQAALIKEKERAERLETQLLSAVDAIADLHQQNAELMHQNAELRKLPELLERINTICKSNQSDIEITYHTPPGRWMAKTWIASIKFDNEYERGIVKPTLPCLFKSLAKRLEVSDNDTR